MDVIVEKIPGVCREIEDKYTTIDTHRAKGIYRVVKDIFRVPVKIKNIDILASDLAVEIELSFTVAVHCNIGDAVVVKYPEKSFLKLNGGYIDYRSPATGIYKSISLRKPEVEDILLLSLLEIEAGALTRLLSEVKQKAREMAKYCINVILLCETIKSIPRGGNG